MNVTLSLTVNGRAVTASVDPRTLLVQLIREHLQLTGTHVGCDTAQCGACTVHIDGRAVKACSMLALQAQGAVVTTIEGLAKDGQLHPMQEAFRECHALQCGFCTPGVVCTMTAVMASEAEPTEEKLIAAMSGHICRCTGYQGIRRAIRQLTGTPQPAGEHA